MTYEEQLAADLEAARKRAADGIAASDFISHPTGQLIQDWINERVSFEMEKMTSKSALTNSEYLECHGAVRILKDFNIMLQSKAAAVASAQADIETISGQQTAIQSS